ncbi:MAG: DnaD domain protein [Oscillospiraceae bacterium]|nr:DnaD domain protein [Oscillospiraceae bacterium]
MQGLTEDKFISAADRLLSAHDGDVALLYLYLRRHGAFDAEDAARLLCRTRREIDAAWEKLRRMGLTEADAPAEEAPAPLKLPPADELPEYKAEDLVLRSKEDPAFSALIGEAQRVLGHALSSPDLKRLFGIYDYLALPAEVVMVLLNYCVSIAKGRAPSMRYIEKQAYIWANREILTLEQAEEYIADSRRRAEQTAQIGAALGLTGRDLTPTERRYIESWLDMGYDAETIALAYDRTVTNTGALKWSYMNKIIQSWQEKGLRTVSEIEEKDSRRRPPRPAGKTERVADMDRLLDALDKI